MTKPHSTYSLNEWLVELFLFAVNQTQPDPKLLDCSVTVKGVQSVFGEGGLLSFLLLVRADKQLEMWLLEEYFDFLWWATEGFITDPDACKWPGSLRSQPRGRFTVTPWCKETFIVVACGRVVQGRSDYTPLEWKPPSPRSAPRQRLPPGP